MKVIEIVREHLMANGFDGLVQTDSECGCGLEDLQPCGECFADCQPAYRGASTDQSYGADEWAMYATKEAADASKTPNVGAAPNRPRKGNDER